MDRFIGTGRIDSSTKFHLRELEAYLSFLRRNAGRRMEFIAQIVTDEDRPDPELQKAEPRGRVEFPSTENDEDADS